MTLSLTGHPVLTSVSFVSCCSYIVYRALAVASGALDTSYKPDYHNTTPVFNVGPYPQWTDVTKIATIDPFGHLVSEVFEEYLKKGGYKFMLSCVVLTHSATCVKGTGHTISLLCN